MKKIFGLWGAANRGKTTTLNILVDLLSQVADSYSVQRFYESRAWFLINGIKIGVCTPGDNQTEIKENIKFFTENECEIIVTATRTKGGSVDELALFKNKHNAELIWIEKKDNPNLNKLVAADIFRRIINEVYIKEK